MNTRMRSGKFWSVFLTLTIVMTLTPLPALGIAGGHVAEPDDDPAQATVLEVDAALPTTGTIDWDIYDGPDADWDYYQFMPSAGSAYEVVVDNLGADPMGVLWDDYPTMGGAIGSSATGNSFVLRYTASEDATSYVGIQGMDAPGDYTVAVLSADATKTVSGTVTDEATGDPIAGALVTAYDEALVPTASEPDAEASISSWQPYASTRTRADGTYTLAGLGEGPYKFGFMGPEGEDYIAEYYDDQSVLELGESVSPNATGIDAALTQMGSISGVVENEAGDPVEGITVRAYVWLDAPLVGMRDPDVSAGAGAGWSSHGVDVTDGSGAFAIEPVMPGTYILLAEGDGQYLSTYHESTPSQADATQFELASGQDITGKDIVMLEPATIGGTVTDESAAAIETATVTLYEWTTGELRDNSEAPADLAAGADVAGSYWQHVAQTQTDASGDFAFGKLTPGTYTLRYQKDGFATEYWDDRVALMTADAIVTGSGDDVDADAVLSGWGSLEGTITVDGAPFSDWQWTNLLAWSDWYDAWVSITGQGWTGPAGWSFEQLTPGEYVVECGATGAVSEYYDDSPTIMGATPVTVTGGATTSGIDADLTSGGASISGTVVNDAGDPLPDIYVQARFLDEPVLAKAADLEWRYGRGAWTDASGEYTLTGLDPDLGYAVHFAYFEERRLAESGPVAFGPSDHVLAEVSGLFPYAPEVYDDAPVWEGAESLWDLVSFDATTVVTSIDATLTAWGAANGLVTDQKGNPLDGMRVELHYKDAQAGWTKVDAQTTPFAEAPAGTHWWTMLKAGEWKLRASDPSGRYASAWSAPFTVVGEDEHEVNIAMQLAGGPPVAGEDRYLTAVAVSQSTFDPGEAGTVVLASGVSWADTLGGAALASALNGPVLLTRPGALPAEVAAEIERLEVDNVIVIGGTAAITADVAATVDALPGVSVERIAGADRYDTCAKVAARVKSVLGGAWHGRAIVATGLNYPDAMSAAPISAADVVPILLTRPDVVPSRTMTAIQSLGVTDVILLGGTTAVSGHVAKQVAKYAAVERLGGEDRYHTSALIAQYAVDTLGLEWQGVGMATGQNYPDALVAGVNQGRMGRVLMLTATDYLPSEPKAMLVANKASIDFVQFYGGDAAISPAVRSEIEAIVQ